VSYRLVIDIPILIDNIKLASVDWT